MATPDFILNERELYVKAKEIKKVRDILASICEELQSVLMASTKNAIKDDEVSTQLIDISESLGVFKNSIEDICNQLTNSITNYRTEINSMDSFKISSEYDNVLLKAVDSVFSIWG